MAAMGHEQPLSWGQFKSALKNTRVVSANEQSCGTTTPNGTQGLEASSRGSRVTREILYRVGPGVEAIRRNVPSFQALRH